MKIISFAKQGNRAVRPHYRLLGEISGAEVEVIELEEAEEILSSLEGEKIFMESAHSHKLRGPIEKAKEKGNTFLHDNEEAVNLFNSKWDTYRFLRANGFKQQETFLLEDNQLGFPFVLKSDDGNQGREVMLIANESDLEDGKAKLSEKRLIAQRFNKNSPGKDTRVVIFKDRTFFYQRNGEEGSFISNVSSGGHTTPLKKLPEGFELEIERLRRAVYSRIPSLENEYFAIDLFIEEEFNIIEMNYNPDLVPLSEYYGEEFETFFLEHLGIEK